MTATLQPPPTAPTGHPAERLRLDRVCAGLLAIVAGVGWIVDNAGASVPWRLFPSFGLVLVGVALLASLGTRHGRGGLVGLGAVLLLAALLTGVSGGRFVGPAGDRDITPTASDWPVHTQLSAGKVTIDLTRYPLPESGQLTVSVGAGEINVLLPSEAPIRIVAAVAIGKIIVTGQDVQSGIDVHWTDPDPPGTAIQLDLRVAVGSIGVDHA